MLNENQSAGDLLREWRQRRRLSQLALAVDAEISQRHLSFLESGRSQPSREMVLHLTERLAADSERIEFAKTDCIDGGGRHFV